jgi:O-antigen/teichoic acid export membrane protein
MKKLRHGIASVVAFQGTFALVQLLQVPILLAAWGVEQYGIWLLLQIAQMIAARSDFGLAIAGSKELTVHLLRGNAGAAVDLFHSMLSGVLCLQAASLLLLVGLTAITAPAWDLDLPARDIVLTVFWMTLAGFMMSQMETLYGVFYSLERQPVGMMIRTLGQWTWLGALAAAVFAGFDIPGTAMAAFFGLSVQVLVSVVVLWRTRSPLTLRLGRQLTLLKPLLAPSLSMASLPAAQIISLAVPRLVLSNLAGPSAVAVFNAHRQLTRVISIVFGLSLAFEPRMTIAKANEDRAQFLNYAVACQLMVGCIAFIGALLVVALAGPIFKVWTNGKIEPVGALILVLVLAAVAEAIWRAVLSGLTAANEHTRVGLTYLAANVSGLVIIFFAASRFVDPALAFSIGILAIELVTLGIIARTFMRKNGVSAAEWRSTVGKALRETLVQSRKIIRRRL